jgi:phosphoribosyl 1,2-cyclic phosphodiesterase
MRVKYWGVRGSLPSAPSPAQLVLDTESMLHRFFQEGFSLPSQIKEFIAKNEVPQLGGYGTATTCAEVISSQGSQIIIDGGSGIRALGESMMKGPASKGKAIIHIFLTHFHWDHLLGLPFFTPNFIAGNRVNYYAVQPEAEALVRGLFQRPYFPVAFEALASNIRFYQIEPRKPMKIDDFTITPYQLDHPDPCWGYKIENDQRVYSHCVDSEGTRASREALGPDLPLYQNVDLMYFDAQYTLPELAEKANWGHSAAQIGLDIAFRESVKYIVFAHHDPGARTQHINELHRQTQDYFNWKVSQAETNHNKLPDVKWCFAHEGLEVDLGKL